MYLWMKAFHVAAVTVWVSGILISGLTITFAAGRTDAAALVARVRKWDRFVTTPAMLLLWALGLTMAFQAWWFSDAWFLVKLAIVFLLSGVHGALSGTLRRLGNDPAQKVPPALRFAAPVIIVSIIVISGLVVVKPF